MYICFFATEKLRLLVTRVEISCSESRVVGFRPLIRRVLGTVLTLDWPRLKSPVHDQVSSEQRFGARDLGNSRVHLINRTIAGRNLSR